MIDTISQARDIRLEAFETERRALNWDRFEDYVLGVLEENAMQYRMAKELAVQSERKDWEKRYEDGPYPRGSTKADMTRDQVKAMIAALEKPEAA